MLCSRKYSCRGEEIRNLLFYSLFFLGLLYFFRIEKKIHNHIIVSYIMHTKHFIRPLDFYNVYGAKRIYQPNKNTRESVEIC